MPTKTRKRKITGLLGKGATGRVFNARSDTLYKELQTPKIETVELYTTDEGTTTLTDSNAIRDFFTFLRRQPNIIVKLLKTTALMRKQRHFTDEITINREVVRRYGSHAADYLTVAPIKGFRSLSLMGAVLTRGTTHTYMIFGHKCNNHYDMHVNTLLSDVIDSLCILHKAKFLHNDIKLDNIVLCGSRYKLIDWGRAGDIDNLIQGTLTTTNPVKWFLMGIPAKACVPALKMRTRMLHPSYSYSSLFERVYSRIQTEFNTVITRPFSSLLDTYAPCFDVFMTGMMLLHAIHVYKLDEATYLPIVNTFTSLIHPLNPLQAKKYLAKHV